MVARPKRHPYIAGRPPVLPRDEFTTHLVFYHPTLRHVLPSQDITFDESAPFYRLFPCLTAPLPPSGRPPPPLLLAPGPPPVDPLPPQGPAPSGVSQVDPLPLAVPMEVAVDSGAATGAASGGAASECVEPASAEPCGAEPDCAELKGADSEGAEPGGAEPRGTASAKVLRRTRVRSGTAGAGGSAAGGTGAGGAGAAGPGAGQHGTGGTGSGDPGAGGTGAGGAGASSPGGAGVTAEAGGTRGAGAAGPGGARSTGTGAAGAGGVGGAGAGDPGAGGAGAGGTGAGGAGAEGTGAGGAGVGGVGAGGAGAGGAGAGAGKPGAGGTVQQRPFFVPPQPSSLRTITLTQSHMVHQVLQRFGFRYSSPHSTPLPTGHSLSTPPSDESVEPSGPYPELVGCLMNLMTCTRPDLAYPFSILARYVAPRRHRPEHREATERVLRYLCSTSGMGLVLGGRGPVVLTKHADASWGYTFSLGSGSVSWRSTRSSSVLSSSCEVEIYAGAMAAQELRWLTYLLTVLGERPCSSSVMYVDNKAMIALC
ncbi:unnamed protein product [Closterium sp. NIES-53]